MSINKTNSPHKIKTTNEMVEERIIEFVNTVNKRLILLETHNVSVFRDLSSVYTTLNTLKGILIKNKLVTEKQFEKEFVVQANKTMKRIKEISKNNIKEQRNLEENMLTHEDIMEIVNDPNIAHS